MLKILTVGLPEFISESNFQWHNPGIFSGHNNGFLAELATGLERHFELFGQKSPKHPGAHCVLVEVLPTTTGPVFAEFPAIGIFRNGTKKALPY